MNTWQSARTKSTIALPSKRVDPVKMRSTATTTLCDIVSPIDSLTLAAIVPKIKLITIVFEINGMQSNKIWLRSSELMLTLGKSERCRLVAALDPKPGRFKFKFMAPRFKFKLLPWDERKGEREGEGEGERKRRRKRKKDKHELQRWTRDQQTNTRAHTRHTTLLVSRTD